MNDWYLPLLTIVILGLAIPFINPAYAQVDINDTSSSGEPCFLNYTAGKDLWSNCGFQDDYMAAVLLPWEWVSGGYFSMIVVGVIVFMTYIKYHTVIYPITIGYIMLPTTYFLFPDIFLSYAIILTFLSVGILVWYAYVKQTKEN